MVKSINNITAIVEDDLTTPTASAKYPIGLEIETVDGSGKITTYKYFKAHGGLTVNVPYVVDFNGVDEISAAPKTNAGKVSKVVVPQVAVTSGYYAFGAVGGYAEVVHKAETYAVGDHLQVLNTGVVAVVDGTSGSTTKTEASVGVTVDAGTTNAAGTVYLYNEPVVIAAT